MKKILSFILVISLVLTIGIPAFASGTDDITFSEVSCTVNSVTFSGDTGGVMAAVTVCVYDGDTILAMESFLVNSGGAFFGTISGLELENGNEYTLKAADYDGGPWATEAFRFTLTGTATISGTAKYDQTLTAALNNGNTVEGETVSYQWKRGTTGIGTGATYNITADDIGHTITVTISGDKHDGTVVSAATAVIEKADGSVTAPTAKTGLTYTGAAQELVNAGSTTTGTLKYKLGASGAYSTAIPTASAAGTYTVYYKVEGDATHNDVAEASISVTIASASAPVNPPVTPPDTDKSENVETETVKATVSDGKVTVKEIDTTKKTENEPISLDFSGVGTGVNEIQLPPEVVTAISEASENGAEIKLVNTNINLDAKALQTISQASDGKDVSLSVKIGEDAVKDLTDKQAEIIGSMQNTIVISASITAGDTKISDFGGGTVELTIDYPWNGEGVLRAAFVRDDGSIEFVPVTFVNGKAIISVNHFSSYVVFKEEALPFVDVTDPMAYYYDAVKWAVNNKVTEGLDDTHFAPSGMTTRAQMVTFLWRAAGSPVVSSSISFSDVPENTWYTEAVRWAVINGITGGTGDNRFSPDTVVDRAQAVTFLYRYSKSPAIDAAAGQFKDVAADTYYYNAVLWAVSQGITDGTGNNAFSPENPCARGQVVTFLYRTFVK